MRDEYAMVAFFTGFRWRMLGFRGGNWRPRMMVMPVARGAGDLGCRCGFISVAMGGGSLAVRMMPRTAESGM